MNTLKIKTWLNNLLFLLLPIKAKRMLILKDALKHLHSKRMEAQCGCVINIKRVEEVYGLFGKLPEDTQLQDLLVKHQGDCYVCQRGALLFSYVWRVNKFKTNTTLLGGIAGSGHHGDSLLQKLFPLKQLMLMETAFEGNFHQKELTEEELNACRNIFFKYPTSHLRMEAILKNTIRNNGVFKPEQEY